MSFSLTGKSIPSKFKSFSCFLISVNLDSFFLNRMKITKNRPKKTFIIFVFHIDYRFSSHYEIGKWDITRAFNWFIINNMNFKTEHFFKIPT